MTQRSESRLEVVRAEDRHADLLAEFIRRVWEPQATAESVLLSRTAGAERNVAEPGVAPPTWIAIKDGTALGYVTTIPIRLWDGVLELPAYWIKGLMVLPEFRSGPIGYLILKAATAGLPRAGSLAVAPPARRLFEALGYRDLGPVPNYLRPLAPARILQRLDLAGLAISRLPRWAPAALKTARATGLSAVAGWSGGMALRAAAAVSRLPSSGLQAGPFDPSLGSAELEELWQRSREGFPSAVVRNPGYLMPRYRSGLGSPYAWLAVRREGRLAGVAVLRRPRADGDERLKGIRVATLADVLYLPDNPAAGLALLGEVEGTAQSLGADAILASSSAPAFNTLLRRQCYLQLGGNVHFLLRDITGVSTRLGTQLADWWVTRGDGGADEVF